ncbi:hypothetical protein M5K25_009364 [Dendrobium thyrsiflorum]|uniref:Uncharacterized protein n=1 Tax=Dendrobium thyrsiflorum TaxID=117978 RepID=A0ABD0V6K7_DENTH
MGPNQRPKARLEGSNHNLDYQTISEHDMLIPPPDVLPDHHLRPDTLPDYHLRPDVLCTWMPDFHLANDYGPSSLLRRQIMVSTTSVAKSWSLRPPSPVDNGISDLCRPLTMVLSTSFADYGPFDLHRQTTVNVIEQSSDIQPRIGLTFSEDSLDLFHTGGEEIRESSKISRAPAPPPTNSRRLSPDFNWPSTTA